MPYHPLIHGALVFLIGIPVIYWLTGEIKWKFVIWIAIGTILGYFIGTII